MFISVVAASILVGSQPYDSGPRWRQLQSQIEDINRDWNVSSIHENGYKGHWRGEISLERYADNQCIVEISGRYVYDDKPSNPPFLLEAYSANISARPGDTIYLLEIPFEPIAEEPLPADFPRNLYVGHKKSDGGLNYIVIRNKYLSGREVIADNSFQWMPIYYRKLDGDNKGDVDTQKYTDLFSSIGRECGFDIISKRPGQAAEPSAANH
ncbi:hypothetical protein [Sphingomicrobium astaxanthinifaciens]|uniref:hypothetical protein n=1 Tax=Sphingomicrobium astaxanthinifaciens TaxID=1227949 RepID=UPI001FCADC04|nr:hypothetical protein [Sphingomicrobium astaxanthinifaciens]MCJ7420445.1 hypothetical protein [Sphingomicrobium astaxanthinifaciens]